MKAAGTPVLVVGGRTTGLMMASELARHGVPVRIVDKSPGIDPHSRATVLHSRTQEIFHDLGIVREVIDLGQPLHGICLHVNGEFVGRSREEAVDSAFPFGVALSQAKTEGILERHLNGLGVVVERSTEMTAMTQHPDRVVATLEHADGHEEAVETPWLIGCDGAHSTVRHLCGEPFPGEADPYPYMLADVVVDGPLKPEDAYVFLHDRGDLFIFILDEGRRLVVADHPKGTDLGATPTLDQIQTVLTERGLPNLRVSDPRWLTHFHIQYRLAPHYRHERVFLAGDAAHIHSLLGGQGMNTGIQDAHNLAWKLSLVMRGVVPSSWLDTYVTERRKVAEDVVASTRLATERAEIFASLGAKERERLLEHMFVPEGEKLRARRHAEALDLDYGSSPICVEPDERLSDGPRAGVRAPDAGPILVDGQATTLFDLLRSPRHSLLLFCDGAPEGLEGVAEVAASAITDYGDSIDVFVVSVGAWPRALAPEVTVIEDPQRALHERYGAPAVKLYLIRPDQYVAYRSRQHASLGTYFDCVRSRHQS